MPMSSLVVEAAAEEETPPLECQTPWQVAQCEFRVQQAAVMAAAKTEDILQELQALRNAFGALGRAE